MIIREARHTTFMVETTSACKIMVGKLEGKIALMTQHRWEDNFEMGLRTVGCICDMCDLD
jgi:hypothetical protein